MKFKLSSLLCAHSLDARMARMPRRPKLIVRMPCVFQVQTFIPLMAEETIRRGLRGSTGAGESTPTHHPQKTAFLPLQQSICS